MTVTPTNNSNVFGVHIRVAPSFESAESKTFDLIALFDVERYGALCIDSVPMCSKCLASCVVEVAAQEGNELMIGISVFSELLRLRDDFLAIL